MSNKINYIMYAGIVLLGTINVSRFKVNATMRGIRNVLGSFTSLSSSLVKGNIRNTLNIDVKFKEQVEELIRKGHTTGFDSYDILKPKYKLYNNRFYYQTLKEGEQYIYTAINKPSVVDVEGSNVTVEYKDHMGEVQRLTTIGLPNWVRGIDIITDSAKKSEIESRKHGTPKVYEGLRGKFVEIPSIAKQVEKQERRENSDVLGISVTEIIDKIEKKPSIDSNIVD